MPFGVKRSASRSRSVDSLSTLGDEIRDAHIEDPEENQVNETINVNLSNKEYKTLHDNPILQSSLNETLQDPVKKTWFKVFNQYNNNLKDNEAPINLFRHISTNQKLISIIPTIKLLYLLCSRWYKSRNLGWIALKDLSVHCAAIHHDSQVQNLKI